MLRRLRSPLLSKGADRGAKRTIFSVYLFIIRPIQKLLRKLSDTEEPGAMQVNMVSPVEATKAESLATLQSGKATKENRGLC